MTGTKYWRVEQVKFFKGFLLQLLLGPLLNTFPPGMRRRSYVSFRSDIGRDVVDYAESSSRRRDWYVNEIDLLETSLWRLIGT